MGCGNVDALTCLVCQHNVYSIRSERWDCAADENGELEWTRPLLPTLTNDETGSNRGALGEAQNSIKRITIMFFDVLLKKVACSGKAHIHQSKFSQASTEVLGGPGLP